MSLTLRLLLATAVSAAAAAFIHFVLVSPLGTAAILTFWIAAVIIALLSPLISAPQSAPPSGKPANRPRAGGHQGAKPLRGSEQGTVKWFNISKGYGFITRADGSDIFVHYRSIEGQGRRNLREGQAVEFVPGQGDKGPQAESVRILD